MKFRFYTILLTGASSVGLAASAAAQTAPQPATPPLAQSTVAASQDSADSADIIVTAQRREQSLSDVGLSITAIGAQTLSDRNITQAEDLQRLVPGLAVSDSGFATPIYTLRGVGVNEPSIGSASSVAIYVDEIPLAYPVMTQGAALDLQRIEVLKGPQGTLYGQNSTGGAINYIANKPTNTFQAGISATYGRFNRAQLEGYVSGPITSTLTARIAARGSYGDGWQRSITRDASLGRIRNFTGRAIIEWKPTDRFRLTLNANGWRDGSDTAAAQLIQILPAVPANTDPRVLAAPLAPRNARAADWDPGADFTRDDKFGQISARAEYDISDQATLTSITSYSYIDRKQQSDNDGIGSVVDLRSDQLGKIKSFGQEVRFSANFSGINWVVGANYGSDKTDENIQQILPVSSQVRGRATGAGIIAAQSIKTFAVFTNIDIPIVDRVTVGGGIRLSNDVRRFTGCSTVSDIFSSPFYTGFANSLRGAAGLTPIPALPVGGCFSLYTSAAGAALDTAGLPVLTPGLASRRLKQDNVPWNVNLNFKPTDRSLIYLRVSRGFKSGNFASLNTLDAVGYNPVVQEQLTAYELGGRARFSRFLRVEGAIFQYDYINKQLRARINVGPPLGNIGAQQNIPSSRLKGAEATIVVTPVNDLSLSASATYIDSKIRNYVGYTVDGAANQNFAGASFNFTPKWSVNADLNYRHELTSALDVFTGVNYAYRGKTSSVFTPPGYPNLTAFDINAYSLVDAQLGVESSDRKWKAWVWGKNIFDTYYSTNVIRVTDVVVRYAGMPATYGVSASYKF